ncbi:MAG: type II toxin-antitoxin system HicA family toxin [Candidatus Eremiobacteraeota bacterium]|nr:type II toxin-antitoxin system HicA family toxin [Candidatus Eremiobacteraeota bacterium]
MNPNVPNASTSRSSKTEHCSFEDLENLLLAVGFSERRTTGSHIFFKRGTLAISIPKRKPVKENYVEQVIALIDSG